jgi:hypothetical protein
MQPGLQRKSFLPPGGKKIEAESRVFGAGAPKMRTYFLNLLTLLFYGILKESSLKKFNWRVFLSSDTDVRFMSLSPRDFVCTFRQKRFPRLR